LLFLSNILQLYSMLEHKRMQHIYFKIRRMKILEQKKTLEVVNRHSAEPKDANNDPYKNSVEPRVPLNDYTKHY
jgi:hypothetical protein